MIKINRNNISDVKKYKFDFDLGAKSKDNYNILKKTRFNLDYSKIYEETFNSKLYTSIFRDKFIRHIFGINYREAVYLEFIKSINELNSNNYLDCCNVLKQSNSKRINKPKKYKYLLSTIKFYSDIEDLNYCDREDINYKYNLLVFLSCFEYIEPNGNLLLSIFAICNNKTLNIIYLGLKLFENINIFIESSGLIYLYYTNFNPNIKISKLKEYLDDKKFNINNKQKLNIIEKYYKENVNNFSSIIKLYYNFIYLN